MNKRPPSSLILLGLAVALAIGNPSLSLAADPGTTDTSTPNTPSAATAPAAPLPPAATTTAPPATPEERPATYTVVSHDSLWKIAHKYGCTVVQLRKLNNLKKGALLHPGQVLQIPPATSTDTTAPAAPATAAPAPAEAPPAPKPNASVTTRQPGVAVIRHESDSSDPDAANSLRAQPVQAFDTASADTTSAPVSILGETGERSSPPPTATPVAPAVADTPAPRADRVSPAAFSAASSAATPAAPEETAPNTGSLASTMSSKHATTEHTVDSDNSGFTDPAPMPPEQKLTSRESNPLLTTPADDWANRFMHVAQDLADKDIEYDEAWCPPGESHAWAMDCSNTARYVYKAATGISLPRTASDQYYYLHLQNKAWDVPQASDGYADCQFLRENLKPGDLLFWENTYRPERQPPITHVMVYLGTNGRGEWLMVGSQTSRGGLHNRRHGGPDIYVFDPHKPCGGYSTWLGLVHHKGRFCAFGRPLEADKSKLAVATDQ